jgi:hypothetical protein
VKKSIDSCPSKKRRFYTENEALEALYDTKIKFQQRPDQGPVNVYCCDWCDGWHLTSVGNLHPTLRDETKLKRIAQEQIASDWERKWRRR